MSEHLPNEEMDRQFNDLPLPDEEASWQKMKELLDKDDDDDRIVPPVFLRSCMGWGFLLLTGLIVAWLIVRPEKWWSETSKTHQTSSSDKLQKSESKKTPVEKDNITLKQNINKKNAVEKIITSPKSFDTENKKVTGTPSKQNERTRNDESVNLPKSKKKVEADVLRQKDRNNLPQQQKPDVTKEDQVPERPSGVINNEITDQKNNNTKSDTAVSNTNQQQTSLPTDTVGKTNVGQPQDSAHQKKAKQPQKKLFLTAGIGEQQLIPIAGQTAVPYSHYGRKGSLSDYVPSVFVQLQKEKNWFLQGEFRYGAAQSVKEFSYNQKTKYDTQTKNVTITNMRLKKTYYHQLPLSFNYYLIPNLSVGIGGMYSRFYSAITEKETTTWNTQTQAVTTVKEIIPIKHFTDSFLYKTQVHFLVQADYQWRKFSFGLRYTKDVQPYIKYTRPDGTVDEEKNQSLQLMIRYRLWQSNKF